MENNLKKKKMFLRKVQEREKFSIKLFPKLKKKECFNKLVGENSDTNHLC